MSREVICSSCSWRNASAIGKIWQEATEETACVVKITCTVPLSAAVHEANCTNDIEQALAPREPFVDSAYVSAELLGKRRDAYGIALRGQPARTRVGRSARRLFMGLRTS